MEKPKGQAELFQTAQLTSAADRRVEAARDTFLSRKYGPGYRSIYHEGMDDEFDRWRARKVYGETGEIID